MIELTVKKITTTLIILLFVNISFFPIVSADNTGMGNIGVYNGITQAGSPAYSKNSVGAAPLLAPVVLGVFGIEIGADIAALLGLASAGGIMVVLYNDGSLAFVNPIGDYVKITNAVAKAAINGILDSLGLRSASSYKYAYSRPEGGLKWGNEPAVTNDPPPCKPGIPETSVDYTTPDGKILIRRVYYGSNGYIEITWDFTKPHKGKIPHAHRWFQLFDSGGKCILKDIDKRRPEVTFNKDGSEILEAGWRMPPYRSSL